MKIINIDDSDKDYKPEIVIAESLNNFWAKEITILLNSKWSSENSSDYFVVVSDNYKLYIGE